MAESFYKLGSCVQDSLDGVKCFRAKCVSAGADRYMTLEENEVDYQVPAGKKLYITAFYFTSSMAAAAEAYIQLGYGDDGVDDGASAPTNFKKVSGAFLRMTTPDKVNHSVMVPIPAEKYPCVYFINTTNPNTMYLTVYGIEK